MNAVSGVIMLAITPLIAIVLSSNELNFPQNYALIFAFVGGLFVISIFPVIFVREVVDASPPKEIPSFSEYARNLTQLLQGDHLYRRIVFAQILTSLYLMAMPFYIGFGTTQLQLPSATAVPVLLMMQTIGNIVGALLYTWLGAHNNLLYLRLASFGAIILPITALIASFTSPIALYVGFLLSGTAISNLMLAYQNWIITHAPPEERPTYIGLSNTIIAIVSMIAPIIGGTIVQFVSYEALFIFVTTLIVFALLMLPSHNRTTIILQ